MDFKWTCSGRTLSPLWARFFVAKLSPPSEDGTFARGQVAGEPLISLLSVPSWYHVRTRQGFLDVRSAETGQTLDDAGWTNRTTGQRQFRRGRVDGRLGGPDVIPRESPTRTIPREGPTGC